MHIVLKQYVNTVFISLVPSTFLSLGCVVCILSFLSIDDQGLEGGGLWWNPRPTLHAGESTTVLGHAETKSHVKDLNLIVKDCSALFILCFKFSYKRRGGKAGGEKVLCKAIACRGEFFPSIPRLDLYCNKLS